MTLRALFLQKKNAIVASWLDKTLASYPPDAIKFFKGERDQFANPVGQAFRKETEAVFSELTGGKNGELDAEKLCVHLDGIIKIRAVQDMTPSRAVSFVFLLKDVIREELKTELQDAKIQAEWTSFLARIDQLALFAFDVFTSRREQVYQLRVNEVKRSISGLIRRLNREVFVPGQEGDPDKQEQK